MRQKIHKSYAEVCVSHRMFALILKFRVNNNIAWIDKYIKRQYKWQISLTVIIGFWEMAQCIYVSYMFNIPTQRY